MKAKIVLSLSVLFFMVSCGSTCDRIFKSLERDQVYDYIGFENSSYWTLSNGTSTIEVTKKTYASYLSSNCDQVNVKSDWIISVEEKKYTVHQKISHNKKIKYSFAEVEQFTNKDSIELTTIHYNKNLTTPQNDSTFYFIKKYKGYKNVLCYNFYKSGKSTIEAIYIAPKIGPVEVKLKGKERFVLKNPNTVMADVEDFR